MSVKKKRHNLRLTTHAEVVSFNMVVRLIDKADRLQKMGVQNMKYQLIYSMQRLNLSARAQ